MRTAYHRDADGLAFNVKRYGMADLRGTDAQRELAYDRAQESWWNTADELAKAHGFDGIITVGRNGGWAAPFPGVSPDDAEPETMARFSALEDAMEAHLRDADSLFSAELDSVIEDDARRDRADAITKRQCAVGAARMNADILANALRQLANATYHMTDTSPNTGDAFREAHREAREAILAYDEEHQDYSDYLRGLPLAEALWWAIENDSDGTYFFLLRERYRTEHQS